MGLRGKFPGLSAIVIYSASAKNALAFPTERDLLACPETRDLREFKQSSARPIKRHLI